MFNVVDDKSVEILGTKSGSYYNIITIPDSVTYNNTKYEIIAISGVHKNWNCRTLNIPTTIKSIGVGGYYPLKNIDYLGIADFEKFCKIEKTYEWIGGEGKAISLLLNEKVLTKVEIPESINELPDFCFKNVHIDEVIIKDGVTSIGKYAFFESKLKSVTLPESVKKIGSLAFDSAYSLKIYLKSINQWVNMEFTNEICRCPFSLYLNEKELKGAIIPSGTQAINSYLFCNVKNLEKVIIPESVSEIGYRAFDKCLSLESLTINGAIPKIGREAFAENYSISLHMSDINDFLDTPFPPPSSMSLFVDGERVLDLQIPMGVGKIEGHKFQNIGLRTIKVPSSVTEIGAYAFANQVSTPTIELSEGLKTIGYGAFEGRIGYDYDGNEYRTTINYIPSTVSEIGRYAFSYCSFIDKPTLGPNVEKVPEGAFYKCKFDEILMPEHIEIIEDQAFAGNKELKTITIPNSCKKISSSAFESCKNLTNIKLPTMLSIIDKNAFYGCENLKDIKFKDINLYEIGENAFQGCVSFRVVDLNCPNLKTISKNSFSNCEKLDSIIIGNNIKLIADSAFYNSEAKYIDLGNGVEEIGEEALFSRGDDLVTIPSSLRRIKSAGLRASVRITDLKAWCDIELEFCPRICEIEGISISSKYTLIIPDGVKRIAPRTFCGLNYFGKNFGIKSIIIPASVEEIGEAAFEYWHAESIIIGKGVRTIEKDAFSIIYGIYDNPRFSRIVCNSSIPQIFMMTHLQMCRRI